MSGDTIVPQLTVGHRILFLQLDLEAQFVRDEPNTVFHFLEFTFTISSV